MPSRPVPTAPDYDPVVAMILLAKRGISARYIARCVSRIVGHEVSEAEVKRAVAARVRREGAR